MLDVELVRKAAVALAEYACDYDKGRGKDDPVYIEVTEGRDGPSAEIRKKFSSCGELPHWLYWRLGCRASWLNREGRTPNPGDWQPQKNTTALTYGGAYTSKVSREPKPDEMPRPGDCVIVWMSGYDVHVMMALADGVQGQPLRTANYGAGGMQPGAWPGARIGSSRLSWIGTGATRKLHYGTKIVHRIIRIEDIVPLLTAPPNLKGAALSAADVAALTSGAPKPPPPPVRAPVLRRGSGLPRYPAEAEAVKVLQKRLNDLGAYPRLVEDGALGAKSEQALMVFQRNNGLDDTGILDSLTRAALRL